MLVNVIAQNTDQGSGGFGFINLLLPLALVLLIFMMFRKQRKAQKQVQEQRSHMLPGTQVMTQFGLFGTIASIDEEQNKAVLELSPGNYATVHMQALTKVVTEPGTGGGATAVPDDASSLTGNESSRTGTETPAQTAERPDAERLDGDGRLSEDDRLNGHDRLDGDSRVERDNKDKDN